MNYLLLLALVLLCSHATAQFGPLIPRPLNTNAPADTGADFAPRLATDGTGRWLAAWASADDLGGTIGNDWDILVARSIDGGQTWSAPQPVTATAAGDTAADQAPALASDGQGRWIVVWQSQPSAPSSDRDLFFALSTDHGASWSPAQPLNSDANNDTRDDSAPVIDTDARGNWIVAWHANNPTAGAPDREIFVARSTDHGVTWTAPSPLNLNADTDIGDDFDPALATDRQGHWIATWTSNDDLGGSDSDSDLLVAHSLDNGLTWSTPAFLNRNASTDGGEDFHVQIRTDRRGFWLVAWESGSVIGSPDLGDQDILLSHSSDDGLTWSEPASLLPYARHDLALDSFPSLATDRDGRWVLVWQSNYQIEGGLSAESDLWVAYSTDQAVTWSGPTYLASNARTDTGDDTLPAVLTDERGHWLVAWASTEPFASLGTEGDLLFGQLAHPFLWHPSGRLNAVATNTLGSDFLPKLATDGAGHWVAVWMSAVDLHNTGPDLDIFYVYSTNNGVTWSAVTPLAANASQDMADDRDPQILTDRHGTWLAVWSSTENLGNQIGTDGDILFSRSTDHGVTWSAPAPLNLTATNDAAADFAPALATDNAGNWIAAWGTVGAFGSDFDVVVATSADHGQTWSVPMPLNANATTDVGDDFQPQLATDRNGQWIAVWMSNDDLNGNVGDDDILVAYSNDNGARWSMPRHLNSNGATDGPDDDDYTPQIATDSRGDWLVVWHSESTLGNTIGPDLDILFARSTNHGVNWSAVAPLNQNAASETNRDEAPHLATDGAGNWIVVWTGNHPDLGGFPADVAGEEEVLVARSHDRGASWTLPAPLNANALVDFMDSNNPHVAVGAGKWIVAWSGNRELGGDPDIRFTSALGTQRPSVSPPPLQLAAGLLPRTTRSAHQNFLLTWQGGRGPFQVQQRTNLGPQSSWHNAGGATCDQAAVFPLNAPQSFFRVLSLGDDSEPALQWSPGHSYLQAGGNAIADTIYVDGFGINDDVDVLVSGALPLTVQRILQNVGNTPVNGGYVLSLTVQGWTFLATPGGAGYVPGAATQLAFSCQTSNTPPLAPGQTALIEFTLGGPDCLPLVPILEFPCGLFQETMTVQAGTVVAGVCTGAVAVVAQDFFFVNEPNRLNMTMDLDPFDAPNALPVGNRDVWVRAEPPVPVVTHRVMITPSDPGFGYFVRTRSPITGPQAPTIGTLAPVPPGPPTVLTGPRTLLYSVTTQVGFFAASCNVIGLAPYYEEKVNTEVTAISTNGCAIAQRKILARGLYECNFR